MNLPRYAVNPDDCTCCGACSGMADRHFRVADQGGVHEVYRQPATEDEVRDCEDALECCPVDAIVRTGT